MLQKISKNVYTSNWSTSGTLVKLVIVTENKTLDCNLNFSWKEIIITLSTTLMRF